MKTPKFRAAVRQRGLSIYTVVKHLGLTNGSHIYNYANGSNVGMKLDTLMRIVKAMNELRPDQPTSVEDIL